MGSHSTTLTIEVCGIERDVQVDFTVDNYGSSGNGWDDAGDPVELYIEDVTDLSGPGQYAKYEALPDLSMRYHRRWVKDAVTGALTYLDPEPAYGYGFKQVWRDGAWHFVFNEGRNLIEAMERMLGDNIEDYAPDGSDDCDYEPSFYHADTRGEYDV